jgi:hypothetical protein
MLRLINAVITVLCLSILSLPANAQWPSALNWASDSEGLGDRKTITTTIGTSADVAIPRCDADVVYILGELDEDDYCHRYGLIWAPVLEGTPKVMAQQIDWNPALTLEADDGFRLPTIKELIRLVDYDLSDGTRGFTDPLIAYWLQKKCTDNSGDCRSQNVTLADGTTTELKDGYLISSTYVNIDGNDEGGFAQLLGIRIKDGKVAMFESGAKGAVFSAHPNESGMLALCMGLIVDGEDQITGGCDFRVNGDDGDSALKHAADRSIVPVFALLVKDVS